MSDFWTSERVDIAKRMHFDGHTCREIALAIGDGCTRNQVIGKLHRLGYSRPSTSDEWTSDRLAILKSMHVAGAAYSAIAEATGFCEASCRQKASRIGLGRRGNVHYIRAKSTNKPRDFKPRIVEGIDAPSTENAVSIYEVTGCKWAVTPDDVHRSDHLFCNHVFEGKGPYCAFHAEMNRAKPVAKVHVKRFVIPTSLLRVVA
jgi:hypothetical protein